MVFEDDTTGVDREVWYVCVRTGACGLFEVSGVLRANLPPFQSSPEFPAFVACSCLFLQLAFHDGYCNSHVHVFLLSIPIRLTPLLTVMSLQTYKYKYIYIYIYIYIPVPVPVPIPITYTHTYTYYFSILTYKNVYLYMYMTMTNIYHYHYIYFYNYNYISINIYIYLYTYI